MAKTKEELLKMNFSQLRNHCKSLNIKLKLGETKASMIKLILTADPPPIQSQTEPLSKEHELKQKLIDTDIYTQTDHEIHTNHDDNDYKNNTISLSEARKIIKRYCPRRGPLTMTIYPAFSSLFKAKQFKNISIKQFMNALLDGNEKVLGIDNITGLATMLSYWDNISNANGWNLAKQHLNGFQAPPECEESEKRMFSVFNIVNIIPKLRFLTRIYAVRSDVLELLYFMDTLHESMCEVMSNDIYSKIFLSSIILSKFRNEDIKLSGSERYKNVIDFLQKISLEPTAKELFQSRRWNKLKKKGKLVDEINKPQMIMSAADFNKIRQKAIQFGSAIEPQMPRIVRDEQDKEKRMKQIKSDIGCIDTKTLQNKLENALKHKLARKHVQMNEEDEEEKKMDNDDDVSKYNKMIQIGVGFDAVVHKMKTNGVKQDIIDAFMKEHSKDNDNDSNTQRLPNALMASINANRNNTSAPPSSVPVTAAIHLTYPPAPIPVAVRPLAALPGLVTGPPPAPVPTFIAPAPVAPPISGFIASSRIPEQHNNIGLNWQKAMNRYRVAVNKIETLKVLSHAVDLQLYRQEQNAEDEGNEDNKDNDEKENKLDFYDDCFTFYMAQLIRIENGLKEWKMKNDENMVMFNKLEVSYHSKFRPQIFIQLTKSRYNALSEAANQYNEDIYVPHDIIGVIWMFVKPFDELIELKFAVDCITEFFAKDKKEISIKKLPIQSHRGYEPNFSF